MARDTQTKKEIAGFAKHLADTENTLLVALQTLTLRDPGDEIHSSQVVRLVKRVPALRSLFLRTKGTEGKIKGEVLERLYGLKRLGLLNNDPISMGEHYWWLTPRGKKAERAR